MFKELISGAFSRIPQPKFGHSAAVSVTNIWHFRHAFLSEVRAKLGRQGAEMADGIIGQKVSCYAARLHLNRGRSISNPERGINAGYAPVFERLTRFPGRVARLAMKSNSRWKDDSEKPWLKGYPEMIFISDMGDALCRDSDLEFLRTDVIDPIRSKGGQGKIWQWLTKRPDNMSKFSKQVGGFPANLWAMTTLTSRKTLYRVDQLREVQANVRGLSIEPLWERIMPADLSLEGISWVVLGGESGRRDCVRPFDLSWARELRDHCQMSGVAFFLKQLGRRPIERGKQIRLRDGHGGDWNEWPDDLKVRELPGNF